MTARLASAPRWPSVSAVIATRDRPDELREAIGAIVDQDYPGELEVVVVFDQSIVDHSIAGLHERRLVRVLANGRTPGLAGARNAGVMAATGDYVAFCDDDDQWLPGKLLAQVALLQHTPDTAVATSGIVVNFAGKETDRPAPLARIAYEDLLRDRITEVHPSTVMCDRSRFLDTIGLVDENIPGGYGEDYEWLLRAARDGGLVATREVYTRVVWHDRSFFDSRWRTIAEALQWLLARYPDFERVPAGAARVEGQIAFAYAALNDRRGALRWVRRALRHRPTEPRAYLALAVAVGFTDAPRVLRLLHRRGKGL